MYAFKSSTLLLGTLCLLAATATADSTLSYHFTVHDGVNVDAYYASLQANATAANTAANTNDNRITERITIGDRFIGGHAIWTKEVFELARRDPRVALIGEDVRGHLHASPYAWAKCTSAQEECNAKIPWGLASLNIAGDKAIPGPTATRNYTVPTGYTGKGVNVYIIDSGINPHPTEFGDRLIQGVNFVPGEDFTDNAGHGTAMASIIGSKTFGVVKEVTLTSVKIFNVNQISDTSLLLPALQWIWNESINDYTSGKYKGSLINLSGGFEPDPIIEAAFTAMVESRSGDPYAWSTNLLFRSAGNFGSTDFCDVSPGRHKFARIVHAVDIDKQIPGFDSNRGRCNSIAAPGHRIVGWSKDFEKYIGYGTSQAAAFASGVYAGILSLDNRFGPKKSIFFNYVTDPSFALLHLGVQDTPKLPDALEDDFTRLYISPDIRHYSDPVSVASPAKSIVSGFCAGKAPTACGICSTTIC